MSVSYEISANERQASPSLLRHCASSSIRCLQKKMRMLSGRWHFRRGREGQVITVTLPSDSPNPSPPSDGGADQPPVTGGRCSPLASKLWKPIVFHDSGVHFTRKLQALCVRSPVFLKLSIPHRSKTQKPYVSMILEGCDGKTVFFKISISMDPVTVLPITPGIPNPPISPQCGG